MSGNSWANLGQLCVRCRVNVFPHKQVPLVTRYRNYNQGFFGHEVNVISPASNFSTATAQYYACNATTTITTNQLSFVAGAYPNNLGNNSNFKYSNFPRGASNVPNRPKFFANNSNVRNLNNNYLLRNNNIRSSGNVQHYQSNRTNKYGETNTKLSPTIMLTNMPNNRVNSFSKKPLDKHEVAEPVAGEQIGSVTSPPSVMQQQPGSETNNIVEESNKEKPMEVVTMNDMKAEAIEEMGGGGDATSATDTDTL